MIACRRVPGGAVSIEEKMPTDRHKDANDDGYKEAFHWRMAPEPPAKHILVLGAARNVFTGDMKVFIHQGLDLKRKTS